MYSEEKVDTNNGRLRIAGVCEAVVAVLTGVHGRVNSTVVEKVRLKLLSTITFTTTGSLWV